jgi:nicotinate-nucleotide pyrophosphorylase (carboxylating)
MFLPRRLLEEKLLKFLAEDLGQGDVTTELTVSPESTAQAVVITKETGIAAGIEEASVLLESLGLKVVASVADGEKIGKDHILMKIVGNTRTILSVERTLLNILSRMSGIATTTRRLVEKIQRKGLKTKVASTRKTAVGLLYFDKKAVMIGGGDTHRLHLDDMVLIKDNHIVAAGNAKNAINKVKAKASFSKKIEVEVTKVEDVLTVAKTGVHVIMLDNFSPEQIKNAVILLKKEGLLGKVLLEASGGITERNILEFASTGVNIVSLGELTASPRALDLSLEIIKAKR